MNEALFLGAEVLTNNTAELSAIGYAMLWMISELKNTGGMAGTDEVRLVSDSKYATQMIRGNWKIKRNKAMVWRCQSILNELEGLVRVKLAWTKAHRKDEAAKDLPEVYWNGKVDEQAKRGAQQRPEKDSGLVGLDIVPEANPTCTTINNNNNINNNTDSPNEHAVSARSVLHTNTTHNNNTMHTIPSFVDDCTVYDDPDSMSVADVRHL